MRRAKPNRIRNLGRLIALPVLLMSACFEPAHAQQEPPTVIPRGGPPAIGTAAIPYNTWLLYPSLDVFTQYSNNYFLSPIAKISGWSFGETPSITAEWSNGIHTT